MYGRNTANGSFVCTVTVVLLLLCLKVDPHSTMIGGSMKYFASNSKQLLALFRVEVSNTIELSGTEVDDVL